jgi:hypothetical protein
VRAEFYIHAANALELEERFLSAEADRFTLTRASQNDRKSKGVGLFRSK